MVETLFRGNFFKKGIKNTHFMSKYTATYWIQRKQTAGPVKTNECIALVRISDTVVQGWKTIGRDLRGDFDHGHFQTTYPSKERLDEYLKGFEPSTIDEYLSTQFDQHQLDDYFRQKAMDFKNKTAAQS